MKKIINFLTAPKTLVWVFILMFVVAALIKTGAIAISLWIPITVFGLYFVVVLISWFGMYLKALED